MTDFKTVIIDRSGTPPSFKFYLKTSVLSEVADILLRQSRDQLLSRSRW